MKLSVAAVCLAVTLLSIQCAEADDSSQLVEPEKEISGSWQVVQAFRNEEDITSLMDFSQFQINFQQDGTYTFQNYLPFLINEEGMWALDDPQYPNFISLSGNSGAVSVQSELRLPITDGKRQISLTFSPGCASNSYTYIFERAE